MAQNPYLQKFTTNGFYPEANASFEDEFNRLADHMGWLNLGKAYNRHHAKAQAFEQQGETQLPGQSHAQSYFWRFAADGFVPNHNASFKDEFSRLAKLMGWSEKTLEYGQHRLSAIQAEFDANYGSSDKLQGWQNLCRDVGIAPTPTSIKKCRKELAKVFINLHDFVDWRRRPEPRAPFDKHYGSLTALRNHTKKHNKVFPKVAAKQEGFIKALLRHIF
ncbi:hypothetical protein FKW77_000608 [Venturia effusa]|uniref:Uncharacterized protein n=1 Tax=Venturia effusa TaxID=50376 RepID=A0A517KYY0_9PEZI|nr:hypothetical protein FKW77_000608 [Venturia effusa]